MKYSIIIPVYNAENYLDECIKSIVSQKGDYELILVDDGSMDKSGEICDSYAALYPCVRVLHIKNSGAGNARNVGTSIAKGDFLIFCDADDYLCSDFFEKLEISDVDFSADVIFFNAIKFFPDGRLEDMNDGLIREKIKGKSRKEVYEHLSMCNKFPASCWAKLVNRDFYQKNDIKLDGKLIGEDIDWALKLMHCAESYDLFEEGIYYYRKIPNTRSSHGNIKNARDQLHIVKKWATSTEIVQYKEYFESFLAYQYAVIFPAYGSLVKNERRELFPEMKQLKYLLKCGKTRKIQLVRRLVNIFGIDIGAIILYNYVLIRDRGGNK